MNLIAWEAMRICLILHKNSTIARLYFSAVYATGQQEDEDGKSLVRDEREKAITFVFCRDLY